jgi:hypothetical protein
MKGAPEAFCRRSAVFLDHIGAMSRLICHKPDARRPLGLRSPAGPTTDLVTKPRAFRPYTSRGGILILLSMSRGVTDALSS